MAVTEEFRVIDDNVNRTAETASSQAVREGGQIMLVLPNTLLLHNDGKGRFRSLGDVCGLVRVWYGFNQEIKKLPHWII